MDQDFFFQTLKRQYDSLFTMLLQAVELCPDHLWEADDEEAPFWQQALHAAMSFHGSFRESLGDFDHDAPAVLDADAPAPAPGEPAWMPRTLLGIRLMNRDFRPSRTVSKERMADYLRELQARSGDALRADLERGLDTGHAQVWAGANHLEKHIYYLRHGQHHVGRLNSILTRRAGTTSQWVVVERPAFAPPEYSGIRTVPEPG